MFFQLFNENNIFIKKNYIYTILFAHRINLSLSKCKFLPLVWIIPVNLPDVCDGIDCFNASVKNNFYSQMCRLLTLFIVTVTELLQYCVGTKCTEISAFHCRFNDIYTFGEHNAQFVTNIFEKKTIPLYFFLILSIVLYNS